MGKERRIAILGFGREGRATLAFIKKQRGFRGAEIWILDKDRRTKLVPGMKGVHSRLGNNYLLHLGNFDLIFRSPGVPYSLPARARARRTGTRFSSLTELFFTHCPAKIIGITGTKGKGTTATLLYKMLKAARRDAHLAGNVGTPALALLPKLKKKSLVVLELSSFQLQDLKTSPPVAAVLDVFPDHQDAHKNLKEYYEAKANIARFQKAQDKVFFFDNDRMSRWAARHGRGKKTAVDEGTFRLFRPENLKIPGRHNFKNAVMAATIARALGVPARTIVKTVAAFTGNEHRLEFVRKVGNVRFYNDSSSTNPQTSAAAVKAFPGHPKILIAGGKDKNLDYKPLADTLKESRMVRVVLLGENRKKIAHAIKHALKISVAGAAIQFVPDLKAAVRAAYRAARSIRHSSRPPVILFSPGATSFDAFRDYADRGTQFKTLVKKLK
jgi:UDP-N-acetylmuramoylalanine--D-glutamate ligase